MHMGGCLEGVGGWSGGHGEAVYSMCEAVWRV